MIEAMIDFSKANDFDWLQSLMADANSSTESTGDSRSKSSLCIYSGDVRHQSFNDSLSEKSIEFD